LVVGTGATAGAGAGGRPVWLEAVAAKSKPAGPAEAHRPLAGTNRTSGRTRLRSWGATPPRPSGSCRRGWQPQPVGARAGRDVDERSRPDERERDRPHHAESAPTTTAAVSTPDDWRRRSMTATTIEAMPRSTPSIATACDPPLFETASGAMALFTVVDDARDLRDPPSEQDLQQAADDQRDGRPLAPATVVDGCGGWSRWGRGDPAGRCGGESCWGRSPARPGRRRRGCHRGGRCVEVQPRTLGNSGGRPRVRGHSADRTRLLSPLGC